jgi:hypothetical protein
MGILLDGFLDDCTANAHKSIAVGVESHQRTRQIRPFHPTASSPRRASADFGSSAFRPHARIRSESFKAPDFNHLRQSTFLLASRSFFC